MRARRVVFGALLASYLLLSGVLYAVYGPGVEVVLVVPAGVTTNTLTIPLLLLAAIMLYGLFTAWVSRAAARQSASRFVRFLDRLRRAAAYEPPAAPNVHL